MRALVLTNNYPPHELGGYELICQDHVGWLRAHGWDVTVLTSSYGSDAGLSTGRSGESVARILDFHWRDFSHRRPSLVAAVRSERRQRHRLEEILESEPPGIAVVWGLAAISKAILEVLHAHGIPMVAMVEEHWPIWDIDADTWVGAWRRARSRLPGCVWRAAGAVATNLVAPVDVSEAMRATLPVFVSRSLQRAIEASVPEWRGRGRVVSNGLDPDTYQRDRPDDESLAAPLRLLFAGRVEERKGLHTAVAALGDLVQDGAEAELTVVGRTDSAYAADVSRAVADTGLAGRVTWIDWVPRAEMPDVYRRHDVLVFPSIWEEPFGLVPLEAMATGCVVVATGTGGSGEYLRDQENSLLFRPGDARGMADVVRRLLADPLLVSKLRRGGRETLTDYSFERFADGLATAIADAAPGHERKG
ncbi:MAG: glycosyltransferase family 4 protein [Candidatus Dormiibacterota bacterium]